MVIPAVMKKGRSGQLLSVICLPDDEIKLQELILQETSSIGVRSRQSKRMIAERKWVNIEMDDSSQLRIKLACDKEGRIVNAQPEFDDLAKYASS